MPLSEDHNVRRRSRRVLLVAAVAAGGALATAALPPTIVEDPTITGEAVTLEPAVRRTSDGAATVLVEVGGDAPGDVTITWSLRTVDRSPDGLVTVGDDDAAGTAPPAARLRPGEVGSFDVRIPLDGDPTLLVANVSPAGSVDAPTTTTTTVLAALLLPGAPPSDLTVTVTDDGDVLRGEVRTDRPTLVNARLRGGDTVTYPDRLVTPDRPLTVTGTPAAWPSPSLLAVTDERGTVRTVDTGTGAVSVLAALLVLAAAGGLVVSMRHHRSAGSARGQAT